MPNNLFNKDVLTKFFIFLVFGFTIIGVFQGLGKLSLLIPACLLLTPLRDKLSLITIAINIPALMLISLAMSKYGTPEFVHGIPYYFQQLAIWFTPMMALILLVICGGKYCKWILLTMIPSAAFIPTLHFFSYIVFLAHPYKISRIVTAIILTPFCALLLLLGAFFSIWEIGCLGTNKIVVIERIKEIDSAGDIVRVYRTNYQGALGSFGILIRREHKFMPGIVLLKDRAEFDKAYDAEIEKLNEKKVRYVVGKESGVI